MPCPPISLYQKRLTSARVLLFPQDPIRITASQPKQPKNDSQV